MSIIPASRLSRSDLCRLSNNLGRSKRPATRDADAPYRRVLAAVNRSLASVGERVAALHPAAAPMGGDRACR
jgi:hypothetical protein